MYAAQLDNAVTGLSTDLGFRYVSTLGDETLLFY
jgi:hypothetical protein